MQHAKTARRTTMWRASCSTSSIMSLTRSPRRLIREAMSGYNPNKVYSNVDEMFNDILNEEVWWIFNRLPNTGRIWNDIKSYPKKLAKLKDVLDMLQHEQPIPAGYNTHSVEQGRCNERILTTARCSTRHITGRKGISNPKACLTAIWGNCR